MREILCYGDSNTWGYNPVDGTRYDKKYIWTTVLQKELGKEFEIISEGLNGRTTVWEDPIEGEFKSGKRYLTPCLYSHKPLDLVIIFLGTNDLKYKFSLKAYDVAKGVETLVKIIKKSECGIDYKSPEILVIIPPLVGKLNESSNMFIRGVEESKHFSKEFNKVLQGQCHILDSSKFIQSGKVDGVHLGIQEHYILGKSVAEFIKNIF